MTSSSISMVKIVRAAIASPMQETQSGVANLLLADLCVGSHPWIMSKMAKCLSKMVKKKLDPPPAQPAMHIFKLILHTNVGGWACYSHIV